VHFRPVRVRNDEGRYAELGGFGKIFGGAASEVYFCGHEINDGFTCEAGRGINCASCKKLSEYSVLCASDLPSISIFDL
jgi:hypothetical protein